MQVGTRVEVAGRGAGVLAMDNDDGTWNVDFDDDTEADIPADDLIARANQSLDELMKPILQEKLSEMSSGVRVVELPEVEDKPEGWTRFVCFSDTHGLHKSIPSHHHLEADVLLHAGDFSNTGELEQVESFAAWLEAYPAKQKVVIAGNHDITFDEDYYYDRGAARFHRKVNVDGTIGAAPLDCMKAREALKSRCLYLEDTGAEVCGYTIYGSPWQPYFCDWAFQLQRGSEIAERWAQIPESLDVLMVHGPPAGFGDRTSTGIRAGCDELLKAIQQRAVSVNIAGHIHEGYGCTSDGVTLYVNASTCTHSYKPTNAPIVFDLPPPAQLRAATRKAAEQRGRSKHEDI